MSTTKPNSQFPGQRTQFIVDAHAFMTRYYVEVALRELRDAGVGARLPLSPRSSYCNSVICRLLQHQSTAIVEPPNDRHGAFSVLQISCSSFLVKLLSTLNHGVHCAHPQTQ